MMAEPTAETAVATAVPKLTIRVRDLVLDYEVFEDRRAALRQRLVTKQGTGRSLVHALKGVSFDAAEGDAIGVVGPNGSGKSTLLAALAGMLAPTSGEVLVSEEPKLLGVGATLIAAATGYRNIRLGCLASACRTARSTTRSTRSSSSPTSARRSTGRCGRTRQGCAPACTSPSPRPSSRGSCSSTRRSRSATRRSGRSRRNASRRSSSHAGTLMLVSHSMDEISRQCTRALWIEDGQLVADGPVDDVLEAYSKS